MLSRLPNRPFPTGRPRGRTVVAGAVALAVLAACGADDRTADPGTGGATATTHGGAGDGGSTDPTTNPTTTAAGGGWLGGEPDWRGGGDATELEDGAVAATAVGGAEMSEPAMDVGDDAAEARVDDGPDVAAGPLRAGSVDDNEDFAAFVAYLDRIADLGIATRDLDPRGRITVSVLGADGRPLAGATVAVRDAAGNEVARLTTTADGTSRFLPGLVGAPVDGTYSFEAAGVVAEAAAGGSVELAVDRPGAHEGVVALDVLFLLDATGSMSDEIDRLKSSIDSVAERVAGLEGRPDVRLAMTLYRDEGDAFVTGTYDFTSDVDEFRAALSEVVADGGGDYPEALDEGLAEALSAPAWRDPASTVQLVFLVADAPPQVGRQVAVPYPRAVADALARGLKVFPVASSESDDQAEAVFRQIAQATGARFVFLSYGAAGAATGGATDIDRTDYEELALDDLVVRLIAEEVAALTGDGGVVPPPASTTTSVPDGQ